jgi:hypothetical protein
MDTIPVQPLDGEEIERRLMAKAVEEARKHKAPGRPHGEVRDEMLQKMAQLEAKILADTGGLEGEKAEIFYKEAAVAKARRNKGPGVPNDVACADMERMIRDIEQKIAVLTAK